MHVGRAGRDSVEWTRLDGEAVGKAWRPGISDLSDERRLLVFSL